MTVSRAVGIALGSILDRTIPDPATTWHPVAWFGKATARVEHHGYADSRLAGVRHLALCLAPLAVGGLWLERTSARHPVAHTLMTAGVTWVALGARTLAAEGQFMAGRLETHDLDGARARLGHLCGRLPGELDEPELARATVESLAENANDAVVSTLWWGALAGIPGVLVHRGANTLDAMVGHHNARYEQFGWASARFDDLMGYLPARLTGLLAVACAPLVGGSASQAWRIMRRDAHDHPSPNGGWCEAAWAGALGVRLGGRNIYPGGRVEQRGGLGNGSRPRADEVRRGARLLTHVTTAATVLAVFAARRRSS